MVWVQRDHAPALAGVAAWLSVLLPWNVTYSTNGELWVLFVRFPLFEFQYTSGFGAGVDGGSLRTVVGAITLQSGQGLETATVVWGAGGVVTLAALVVSVIYYATDERFEAAAIHPLRLLGGLLAVAAVLFGIATLFVATGGFGGTPIPVGVVLVGLLAWVLLRAELTDEAATHGDSDTPTDEVTTHEDSGEPTDETVNEVVDETVDETVNETVDETVDETANEVVDETANETVDRS